MVVDIWPMVADIFAHPPPPPTTTTIKKLRTALKKGSKTENWDKKCEQFYDKYSAMKPILRKVAGHWPKSQQERL